MQRHQLMPLLLEAVSQDNILPLTSTCNASCVFCSHRQNPPGIRTYMFPPLEQQLLDELLLFLDRKRKIVIGESSSRLCEGEPFTHPLFFKVLEKLRVLYPGTPVQVTTNGMGLRGSAVAKLREIQEINPGGSSREPKLELVVSLNCISSRLRMALMGDTSPEETRRSMIKLGENGVVFHGSVVALPHLTGWDELARVLHFLEVSGARTTRVFLPGFTRLAAKRLQFPGNTWSEIADFLEGLKEQLQHPVTLEPPLKQELAARVEGVMADSPAWHAGVRRGDLLLEVNGEAVISAADGFSRIQKSLRPRLKLQRPGSGKDDLFSCRLAKGRQEAAGLVFTRDLESTEMEAVVQEIRRSSARKPLLLTSSLAKPLWQAAQAKGLLPGRLLIHPAVNRFFGGTIACAGLLTVLDLREALQGLMEKIRDVDRVILPLRPFDRRGFDLQGEHYRELISAFPGVEISFL